MCFDYNVDNHKTQIIIYFFLVGFQSGSIENPSPHDLNPSSVLDLGFEIWSDSNISATKKKKNRNVTKVFND